MSSAVRHVIGITLLGGVILFTNLGGPRLWDRDEPRNAGCAAEMLQRGDWVTPVFNGQLRTHKPILLYWLMMTAYAVFGVTEVGARFWSAAAAVGTALLTYGMGRRLFSPAVGLWAAVILLTTLMFNVAAHAATPDSLLVFWGTAALFVYVWGIYPNQHANEPRPPDRLFPNWPMAVVMYACMGMGVLTKGPVGLILPTAVIGMYLLILRLPKREEVPLKRPVLWPTRLEQRLRLIVRPFHPNHFLRTCWSMRPLTAIAVVLIIALPWYVLVGLRTDGLWIRGFFLEHNLARATHSMEGHYGSALFYPIALLCGFFPWSIFAVPTVLDSTARLRTPSTRSPATLFAICWIGVYIGVFSLAQTKLPSYITPCYPAVALLTAGFVHAWLRGLAPVRPLWPRIGLGILAIIGLVALIGIPIAAARLLPGEQPLALIGLIPMITAIACMVLFKRARIGQASVVFAAGAALLMLSLFAIAAPRVDRHRTFGILLAATQRRANPPVIGTLEAIEPSWVFYAGQPLIRIAFPAPASKVDAMHPEDTQLQPTNNMPEQTRVPNRQSGRSGPRAEQPSHPRHNQARVVTDWHPHPALPLWNFLRGNPDHFVITTDKVIRQLGTLPAQVQIVAQTNRFLKKETFVVLGWNQQTPRTATRQQTVRTAQ